MELKNLISFQKIAEYESFSKAAAVLGYTQPTITFQMKQLENELNVKLFDRLGIHIQITEAGIQLLNYANHIISLSEEAANVITKNNLPPSLPLRISGVCSACLGLLPELIHRYHLSYPNIKFEANTADMDEIFSRLANGSTDIGIIMDFSKTSDDFVIAYSEPNPLYFICAPSNPLASQKDVGLQSLADLPFIATEKNCTYRNLLMDLLSQNHISPNIVFESENTEIIKRFVEYDVGIALLPELAIRKEIEEKRLCKMNLSIPIPNVSIKIVYHKNKWVTPTMHNFIDLISTGL